MSDVSRDAEEIAAYYAQGLERDRLASGPGALEFARTRALLEQYLPPVPAVIADVGGGPGRYAVWLAERGYRVDLVDPVALHVAQARMAASSRPGAALASAEVGDARALRLPDANADAVLLLGPLYHLAERAERLQVLAEARRVCRQGGGHHRRGDLAVRLDAGRTPGWLSRGSDLRGHRRRGPAGWSAP
jgi:ubiquinone/menaquinone biosynthesis C-methylase UbiE